MTFRLSTQGPFSLAEAARFQMSFPAFRGTPLAFPADGTWSTVGVRVTDDLTGHVVANPGGLSETDISGQVARILSLDVDGRGFPTIGERDEVVGDLQRRFPGLRPVLFASAYEAAAWALLTHRISRTQGAALRRRIAEELGDPVDFDGEVVYAFPPPERLAGLAPMPGMFIRKVENLRALGEAAAAGDLDIDLLRAMTVDEAMAHLKKLPGIGPFSAELILIRGVGVVDLFPRETPRLHQIMGELYDLGPEPAPAQLESIASAWRPYRGWVSFLFRNAGS
ncbi:DNA-3-methyladenine glycosylase family protein [Actinoplanes sp. NPDC049265]|uniref:DNA-3-methyladenine glycosylase family protein n=1 Tax=Actinoplanes sp. NPDC049265 TaxID=3363902 RepID=UPI003718AF67